MTLIREVSFAPAKKKWAYVEFSDENANHAIVIGHQEFDTKEEAEIWAKGFDPFSYVRKDPNPKDIDDLLAEKERLNQEIETINTKITALRQKMG
jgi:hypothetical protein